MNLGIEGKCALVMGGSRGLGRAVAEALIAEGAKVAICARDAAKLSNAATKIGATAFPCDLSTEGAAAGLVREVASKMGGVDILLVNTGGPPPNTFDRIDDGAWRIGFEELWMSAVQAIRESLPGMRERRWGRILVVTSTAAREPIPNLMLSNALRAGLHGMVNALSKEIAAEGITINALMPGYTLTERLKQVMPDLDRIAQDVPAKRLGEPREFAAVASFLLSDAAGYVTGQAIACDGGLTQSI